MRGARRSRFASRGVRIAAVLCIPLLFLAAYFVPGYIKLSRQRSVPVTMVGSLGMTTSVVLPDGSKVWLNSDSKLTYPQVFTAGKREVLLDGEAFFSVREDPHRSFTVNAGGVQLEVLGTEFNVEAYSKRSDEVRTTLSRGLVKLSYMDSSGERHSVRMYPCDCYTYAPGRDTLICSKVDPGVVSSWRDGKIVLRNTSLEDALRMVGNRYGVSFVVENPELLGNRFTGTFAELGLDSILAMFTETTNISFEKEEFAIGSPIVIGVH